ncbi:MAG: type IX secretion system membrane protein PorP/SprF [Bacteroidales bacterium]|nr:type IX secretion system membrane protein PorP/SprF [Bacteroidales bacterium]
MKTRNILLAVLAFVTFTTAYSQNDAQMSHYMFNKLYYNPAFAGSTSLINASIMHRQQWVGFNNAPSTQFLMGDIFFDRIGGVGLSVTNDKVGYEKILNIKAMYAYHFNLSDKFSISGGLSVGLLNKSLDGTQLIYENMNDVNAIVTKESQLSPNVDFGLATKYQDITLGLSFTQLNQSNEKATFSKPPRHFYAFASYEYPLNEQIDIIPTLFFKNSSFISQFELNVMGMYDKKFWGGISYRMQESLVILLGLNVTKTIRLGYSYDLNTGPIKTHSSGSHEIMIMSSFAKPQKQHIPFKTPRVFI